MSEPTLGSHHHHTLRRFLRSAAPLLMAWLIITAVYLLTANTTSLSADTLAASRQAWVIAATGSPDLTDATREVAIPWTATTGGQVVTNRFAGTVLYAVPFYWAADLFGASFSPGPGVAAGCASAAAAVVLMYLLLRGTFSPPIPLGASAVMAFGTATWAISADGQWSHGPAQAALVAAMLALRRQNPLLAGVALGAALMARPHLAVAALVIGVAFAAYRRDAMAALRVGAGTIPGLAALAAYNAWVFGRWSPVGGYESLPSGPLADDGGGTGISALPENLVGSLFSPGRGVLILYPVLLVVAAYIPQAWRAAAPWEKSCVLGGLGYLLAQLTLNRYSGGWWFFGSRLTIEPLTLSFPLLVRAWTLLPQRTWLISLAHAALAWTVATHTIGALELPPAGPEPLSDPWTFYDPLILFTRLGWLGAGLAFAAVAVVYLGMARLLHRVAEAESASGLGDSPVPGHASTHGRRLE